ncbi:MAG: 50S ribosomal protein L23 [Gammaproteobacteria bacterium]|nr:50S ribosomal protein L23 [Gammaproteobacteria bacterium]
MIENKLMKTILAPCVSEKSTKVQVDRQYVFKVSNKAKKGDIARAIKLLFEVDVEEVRTCNVKGKKRNFKNIAGKRQDWKKAYVTVKEGQAINLGGA